ncbi:hypothetical protein OL233_07505 [Vagococcus sp. PNs007]|uniref:DUF4145 domain-containing protein n=1 Tax=Vagococcus proximus TaxID=2991417 RepID=A0ABT5X2A7_9ENTE|nr:hypothetical protein [Vagococcus proximus]MDF0480138.1 hypothetical protein [Vagococcus proximus]
MLNRSEVSKKEWGSTLNSNIIAIEKYYNQDIGKKLMMVKNLGNQGSHFGGEIPTQKQIDEGIKIVVNIFEDIVIEYFYMNRFGTEPCPQHVLSYLPPRNRIIILEKLFIHDCKNYEDINICIIDKLTMAFLKDGRKEEAFIFLDVLLEECILDGNEIIGFKNKINMLDKNMSKFNISDSIIDTAKVFKELIGVKKIDDYTKFEKIFFILVKGYISSGYTM